MQRASYNGDWELEFLTRLMDDQFEIFGYRFGLNLIIGLVPEAGDLITTAIALYLVGLAARRNASGWVLFRMLLNIAVYFVIGLIPWLGDVFGSWWKPNRRNLRLLQADAAYQQLPEKD